MKMTDRYVACEAQTYFGSSLRFSPSDKVADATTGIKAARRLVCYTAVFSVVTQTLKTAVAGCVADYPQANRNAKTSVVPIE